MPQPDPDHEQETILRCMRDNQKVERAGRRFDLKLFCELNAAYANRRVVPEPRALDAAERLRYAKQRAKLLDGRIGLRGRRVLEIGCGAGDLSRELAEGYDCQVVGVDIAAYPSWRELEGPNLRLIHGDLTDPGFAGRLLEEGPFERVFSLVVWEHVQHPYALLQAAHRLLSRTGLFYLRANLYRSAIASHLYREVYFPWAHLLFEDEIFCQFYEKIGHLPEVPSWLNKLCYAHYLLYFRQIGLEIIEESLSRRPLDRAFYQRFEEQLSQYPEFDLTLDFFDVVLVRRQQGPVASARRAGRQLRKALLA